MLIPNKALQPGKLSSYWENEVHLVVEQKLSGMLAYEEIGDQPIHVLTYLWGNPTYQFLKPTPVVVVNVPWCMCQRISSSPKAGVRLAAVKIYLHLHRASCNRVYRPLTYILCQRQHTQLLYPLRWHLQISCHDIGHSMDYPSNPYIISVLEYTLKRCTPGIQGYKQCVCFNLKVSTWPSEHVLY